MSSNRISGCLIRDIGNSGVVIEGVPILREQADLLSEMINFIEDLQTLAPGRLLGVINLTQVQHRALNRSPKAQSAVFDNTPIAMLFAILFASVVTRKHVAERKSSSCHTSLEEPWSPLAHFAKDLALAQGLGSAPTRKKLRITSQP